MFVMMLGARLPLVVRWLGNWGDIGYRGIFWIVVGGFPGGVGRFKEWAYCRAGAYVPSLYVYGNRSVESSFLWGEGRR